MFSIVIVTCMHVTVVYLSNYTFYYNTHSCHLKNTIDIYLVTVLLVNCENLSKSIKILQTPTHIEDDFSVGEG